MSLVGESHAWGGEARVAARLAPSASSEYDFLLGRFVDRATLDRACAIARHWGVFPHEVMIANGWLDAGDYCRALAERCGLPYKATLAADETTAPDRASPRQCLARGLLKERHRTRRFVLAPERAGPDAFREMLARLSPYRFSLAPPQVVRRAIGSHFAASFARHAIEGLAARHPQMSAKQQPAKWQRRALILGATALLLGLGIDPVKTVWAVTLGLAILFLAVIAFRCVAAYGVWRGPAEGESGVPRLPDRELPVYSVLVPLYREAHMLPH